MIIHFEWLELLFDTSHSCVHTPFTQKWHYKDLISISWELLHPPHIYPAPTTIMHLSGPHELDLTGIICTISSWVKIYLPMEEQVITSNFHLTGCLQTSEIFHHHHHLHHFIAFGTRIDKIPRDGLIIHLSMSICHIFLSQSCQNSLALTSLCLVWHQELSAGIRVISDGRNC